MRSIDFHHLRTLHAAFCFDAYGVLVDSETALPGAVDAIATLRRNGQPFLVVTNDASRSATRAAARLAELGLDIRPSEILSSGMMIAPALREAGLVGGRVVVLGTDDSTAYAHDAGVTIVPPSNDAPADAVVVADEGGFDLLDQLDATLSMIVAAVRAGRTPRLLLANPDLLYPAAAGQFGVTAGSLALVLEHCLAVVLGDRAPAFEALGKPSPGIFREAIRRLGTADAVMIGDQLPTDIAGAASVGMASALVLGGVSHDHALLRATPWTPTYVLQSLEVQTTSS
jgi:HAD superfamily hydrolase (TIGR01450 family)